MSATAVVAVIDVVDSVVVVLGGHVIDAVGAAVAIHRRCRC